MKETNEKKKKQWKQSYSKQYRSHHLQTMFWKLKLIMWYGSSSHEYKKRTNKFKEEMNITYLSVDTIINADYAIY